MRKTKIICTIGPASEDEETLRQLMLAGMDVARFNFSHGSHEEHEAKFRRLRHVRISLNKPIATMLDTKGPEIRLRNFKDGKVELTTGQTFTLTTRQVEGDQSIASITYKDLPKDVHPGNVILIDDGLVGLQVDRVTDTDIICTVQNAGIISNKKGVNVPDAELSMPFISEQDRSDIEFGCKLGFDLIACSFVRCADDILQVRKILDAYGSNMKVIAKIENTQGVRNLDEILPVVDGIMVARGDLGVEVPMEEVPSIQRRIIRYCQQNSKVVITATQMLDSMIHNPRPTRAEVTDVADAIVEGTSATMLSGETASGQYPVEACRVMGRIAERAEKDIDYHMQRRAILAQDRTEHNVTTAICHAAITVAEDTKAKAILAVTLSGATARALSRLRPPVPVLACTTSSRVACQLNLNYALIPLIINEEQNLDMLFNSAVDRAKMTGLLQKGDKIVLVAGYPLGQSGNTNMIRVVEVE